MSPMVAEWIPDCAVRLRDDKSRVCRAILCAEPLRRVGALGMEELSHKLDQRAHAGLQPMLDERGESRIPWCAC